MAAEAEAREIASQAGRRPERGERHNERNDTDHAPGDHPNPGTVVDVEWMTERLMVAPMQSHGG